MLINMKDYTKMQKETTDIFMEIIKGENMMYEFVLDEGFEDDPRYKEARSTIFSAQLKLQDLCNSRALEICRKKNIIETLKENPIGKKLLKLVEKKLEV